MNQSTLKVLVGPDNAPENFLGLVSFFVIPEDGVSESHFLDVSIAASKLKPIGSSKLVIGQRNYVHIHKALVPDGPQSIVFRILDRDDREVFKHEFPIDFGIKNDLALRVAQRLKETNTPWALFGTCDSSYYPYSSLSKADDLRP